MLGLLVVVDCLLSRGDRRLAPRATCGRYVGERVVERAVC